jgi:hypothetical protein
MPKLIVRAYSPLGRYANVSYVSESGAFATSVDLVWSVVELVPNRKFDAVEREWLRPEEVRLLAAIQLASHGRFPRQSLYPLPAPLTVDTNLPIDGAATLSFLRTELVSHLSREPEYEFYAPVPKPLAVGGGQYSFSDLQIEARRINRAYRKIGWPKHLLIRGLGGLLKGDLLQFHEHFHTEACMSLYVALDATLHLILKRLRRTMPNPSNYDAQAYLEHAFGLTRSYSTYCDAFYEDRVSTIHPSSRFGEFPEAPLSADSFCDLYEELWDIYHFLVMGEAVLADDCD